MPELLMSLAVVTLAATVLTLAIAFLRLRDRHRTLRRTLSRVVAERDKLRWGSRGQAHG